MIAKTALRRAVPVLGVALLAVALVVLHRALISYHYRDIIASLHAIPTSSVVAALAATVLNYLSLVGYEAAAIRARGIRLSWPRTGLVAFCAYSFSHNIGYAAVSGGAIRYRLYSSWGLRPLDVGYIIVLGGTAFWVGCLAVGGAAMLFSAPGQALSARLPPDAIRPLGALALGCALAIWIGTALRRKPITVRGLAVMLPRAPYVLWLAFISCCDWLLVALVIWLLLPAGSVPFPTFVAILLLAQAVGVASQVPGGLGVLEASLVLMLRGHVQEDRLIAALLAYRVIYYLVPFTVASLLLVGYEAVRGRHHVKRFSGVVGRVARPLVPHVFAVLAFFAGAVLLFSGATPPATGRIERLLHLVPRALLDTSHFLGSLAGVGLLLIARGLQLRLRVAWAIACALLVAGAALSVLKGLDWEEAAIMTVLLAVLLPSRGIFPRRSSLTVQHFTLRWMAAIAVVLLCTVWLLVFCFEHRLEGDDQAWWQFALRTGPNATRSVRATVGAVVLLLAFALWRLLRPVAPRIPPPVAADIDRARAVLAREPEVLGHLALVGDKALLFDEGDAGFVMYGVRGRHWIAMGDPVAPPERQLALAERFCAVAAEHAGSPAFYQVHRERLPLYLDLGLTLLKLGEEARVPLERFDLDSVRKDLRRSYQKAADGLTFAVVPREGVAALIDEARAVSDAWLLDKGVREKGFSLGFFSPRYLRECPLAIVRRGDRLVAFANVWEGAEREELSIDLMRHLPEDGRGLMDYLLVELMRWGRAQGFRWFNLGMAPLSGIRRGPNRSLWNRVAALMYAHGDAFYRFRGLREYKEKFRPAWQPRYLACSGGLSVPQLIADLAALIADARKRAPPG